jgi:hypothetical protein
MERWGENFSLLYKKAKTEIFSRVDEAMTIFLPKWAKKHEAVRLRFIPRQRCFIIRRIASYAVRRAS